jgi:hypothetical protein
MGGRREEIATVQERRGSIRNSGKLLSIGMTVANDDINSRKELTLPINQVDHSVLPQWQVVIFHETRAVLFRRIDGSLPVLFLNEITGVSKRRDNPPVTEKRGPAGMVKVQMCKDYMCDIIRSEAVHCE